MVRSCSDWLREEQTCALSLGAWRLWSQESPRQRWQMKEQGGSGAVRHPCAVIYSSLCHWERPICHQKQGCVQGLCFKCTTLHNVHRIYYVRALKRVIEKLFPFQFHVYCTGSCQICQEILPTLFLDSLCFPLWKNVKYYLSHCGDYLSCASNESGPCTMISLHSLSYSSILFVDLPCIYNNSYEVLSKLCKT